MPMSEKQKHKIIEEEAKLSSYNCKSVDYQQFKEYIKEKTKLNDKLRNFYENILFRKLKWRNWIYQRKSEDKFLNQIEETYGNKEDLSAGFGKGSSYGQPDKNPYEMDIGNGEKEDLTWLIK